MPSALNTYSPPANSITSAMLQSACVSGNVIATQSIQPGQIIGGLQACRNKIINGDFDIWQRLSGLSFNISNATTKKNYTADRWCMNVINGNGIWQVFKENREHPYNTLGNQFPYNNTGSTLKIVCSGSDTMGDARSPNTDGTRLVTFQTVIENTDLMELNNVLISPVLSFWTRASKTGYVNVFARPYHGDFAQINTVTRGNIGYFTVNQKDTWEYKQIILSSLSKWPAFMWDETGATYVNPVLSGIALGITLQCGNKYQVDSASAVSFIQDNVPGRLGFSSSSGQSFNVAGDYIYFSNVQLEGTPGVGLTPQEVVSGIVATPFESLPYQQQLAKCQRYCYTINSYLNATGVNPIVNIGMASSASNSFQAIQFPSQLRTVPTLTTISGNPGNGPMGANALWSIGNSTLNATVDHFTVDDTGIIGNTLRITAYATGAPFTVAQGIYLFANSQQASLVFNADF